MFDDEDEADESARVSAEAWCSPEYACSGLMACSFSYVDFIHSPAESDVSGKLRPPQL